VSVVGEILYTILLVFFLLSPEHVEVTAEDKARIAEAGFFNQS
jgi:hypothetical protein